MSSTCWVEEDRGSRSQKFGAAAAASPVARSRPSQVKGCDVDRSRSPVLRRLDLDSSNGRRPVEGRHPHHAQPRRERSSGDRRRRRRRQGTQVACT